MESRLPNRIVTGEAKVIPCRNVHVEVEATAVDDRNRRPQGMRTIPRFVYNPDKADRGLRAMADILAGALRTPNRRDQGEDSTS